MATKFRSLAIITVLAISISPFLGHNSTQGQTATQQPVKQESSQLQSPSKSTTATFKTLKFPSVDGLQITADLYQPHADSNPFIVLCHQAGWSRGEYREIAPKLNKLGFNCLAIDQRSGRKTNQVDNATFKLAKSKKKKTTFVDAEQDIIAAIKYAKDHGAKGKLILWGSSYSAALTLRVAGEHADLIDGALAFAPGEYFERFGKPKNWIAQSAKKIVDPVFVTSAKNEHRAWKSIFAAVPGDKKVEFLPKSAGNHGSRALYKRFKDSPAYWKEVEQFLKQF